MYVMLARVALSTGTWIDWLTALADLSFIIYIPLVLFELRQSYRAGLRERERELAARKDEIYNRLIERYVDWQKLCLQYIDLDIADYAGEPARDLTPREAKEEQLALGILVELFEQAFLAYLDAPNDLRANEWKGWELYIEDYCRKPNFQKVWAVSRPTMDLRFVEFMNAKIEEVAPVAAAAAAG
jgi:hypothetical protein